MGTYTAEEAGGRAADLEVVLADLGAVEHRVEGSDLVDLHGGHLEDLCNLVHRGQGQEVVVLLLSDEQDRNAARRLVVVRVLGLKRLDGGVGLVSELEWRLIQVVVRVSMVREGRESETLGSG